MIRVGVDAWNLPGDRRGTGRYVRALLTRWYDDPASAARIRCELVVPEWATAWVAPRYRNALGGRPLRVVNRRSVDRRGYDLLWCPFNGPAFDAFRLPAIATLHDAAAFALPGFAGAQTSLRRAAERCARIITVSEFSAQELERLLRIDPRAISVIPQGVDAARPPVRVAFDIASLGRYVFFVGEAQPYKGLDVLVDALQQLRATHDVRLVIAGDGTPPAGDGIVHVGRVDDDTLAALYRGAAVFAFPSRYEGFGLPVLEAMAYGTPVVASDAASIPEAGGDAAMYVPSGDAPAFAAALAHVLDDAELAAALRRRGHARAAHFTWARTADATLALFESVAGERAA